MRILFYSDNLYPEISGVSDSIIGAARGLKARGHAVAFVGPRYSDKDYAFVNKTRDEALEKEGFEVCRIPSLPFAGSASGQARNVIPLLWTLGFVRRFKPDVIHSQTPFGTGIEALFVSRILHIPLVGTNHTHIEEFIKIYGPIRTKWAEKLVGRFFSWYYNRCRFVSVVNESLIDDMRQRGFKRPADIVPNPTSLSLFSPALEGEKAALKKELHLPGPTVISAGRIAPEKRVDVVVNAAKHLAAAFPGFRLVVAGSGPSDREVRKLAVDLDIADNVIFTGFLDHATLARWFKAADASVVMCPIETQCLGLMQAFASGLPCAGVDKGAVGEHIKPQFGYTVPDGDDKALADALGKILADRAAARAMGERAREYVGRFSQEAIAERWEKIYEGIIERK